MNQSTDSLAVAISGQLAALGSVPLGNTQPPSLNEPPWSSKWLESKKAS